MTLSITETAARILSRPAPVLIVDSCNFLDLFRLLLPNKEEKGRRVEVAELEATKRLLDALNTTHPILHHVVPELVPGEVTDNANKIVEPAFRSWLAQHDEHCQWLLEASAAVGVTLPPYNPIGPLELSTAFRRLAEDLLKTATVLERDPQCLLRAVERVVVKRRPSHRKELKDSMNLEQALELCRQLQGAGSYPHPLCFVSANIRDFAESSKDSSESSSPSRLHPDLR